MWVGICAAKQTSACEHWLARDGKDFARSSEPLKLPAKTLNPKP